MEYKIEFTKKALSDFLKMPKNKRNKVVLELNKLSCDPYRVNNNVKKLKGIKDSYRLRIGDYRVVYLIENTKVIIHIIKIQHRQEVYK